MKHINYIIMALAAVFATASCQDKESYIPLDYGFADYSGTSVEATMDSAGEIEFSDDFATTAVSLSKNDILKALGLKKASKDLTFFGLTSSGKILAGERNFNSASGFYFNSKGYVCSPSDEDARLFVDATPASFLLNIGSVPGQCKAGEEYTLHLGLCTEEAACRIELKVSVVKAALWADYTVSSDGLTYYVKEKVNTEYNALAVYVDETAVCSALGYSNFAGLIAALSAETATFTGVNANGSEYGSGRTANNYGYWYDASGDVCSWKGDGWFGFAEWDGSDPMFFNVGQATEGLEPGMSATFRVKFKSGTKSVIITFELSIVEKV